MNSFGFYCAIYSRKVVVKFKALLSVRQGTSFILKYVFLFETIKFAFVLLAFVV